MAHVHWLRIADSPAWN